MAGRGRHYNADRWPRVAADPISRMTEVEVTAVGLPVEKGKETLHQEMAIMESESVKLWWLSYRL